MISIPVVLLQLTGALLLGGVFALLRRHARRRPFFVAWSRAWLALAVASAALVSRQVSEDAALVMEGAKREGDDAHAQLAVAHNELRRRARIDTVTGTLTRRAFAGGVGLEVARAGFGAVLMLDMDDLKHVNDEHGHGAGDALLRHLAEVLRPGLRVGSAGYTSAADIAAAIDSADAAMYRATSGRRFGRSSGTVA